MAEYERNDGDIHAFEQAIQEMQKNLSTITTMWSRIRQEYVTLKENAAVKKEDVCEKKKNEAVKKEKEDEKKEKEDEKKKNEDKKKKNEDKKKEKEDKMKESVTSKAKANPDLDEKVDEPPVPYRNTHPIKFATMNFYGGNVEDDKNQAQRRCDLLLPVILEADVVAIQECNSKRPLNKAVKNTHYIYMEASEKTGILLRKASFPPKLFPKTKFKKIGKAKVLTVTAKPNGWDKSVLFVSYHGANRNKIQEVVESVEWLIKQKAKQKADCIIIGGDFNLDFDDMEKTALPRLIEETQQPFNVLTCGKPEEDEDSVRHEKDVIDYFLYGGSLQVDPPTRRHFREETLNSMTTISYDRSEEDKYNKLKEYLDHDPVMTTVNYRGIETKK